HAGRPQRTHDHLIRRRTALFAFCQWLGRGTCASQQSQQRDAKQGNWAKSHATLRKRCPLSSNLIVPYVRRLSNGGSAARTICTALLSWSCHNFFSNKP